jgi:zinc protease
MPTKMQIRAALIAPALIFLTANISDANAQVFDPQQFTLKNGLEIVVIENHRAPIVSHMVWYKVGAADEPPGKSGLAHYFEHLMFMGTEKYASGEFSNIVARNGGRENAFTSHDYTGYFQNIAADRLELLMELEADRMRGLVLTPEVIEPERLVIVEERRQRTESTPRGLLGEQLGAATYSNHPYRLPVIGWEHEILDLSLADLRNFYDTWYAPNNAILVVGGDVEAEEVLRLAETYYGPVRPRDIPERIRPTEPPHHAPREVVLRDARVQEPSWTRRYLAPSYNSAGSEHAYALQLLAEILGGGSTSRLYRKLVIESELAISTGAFYSPRSIDQSTFGTYFTPGAGHNIDDVLPVYQEEIALLLEKGVSLDEVTSAKTRMIDSAIFDQDSLQTAARIFGAALATGRTVEDVQSWPQRIGAVTPRQINEAARAVFIDKNSATGILLPEDG